MRHLVRSILLCAVCVLVARAQDITLQEACEADLLTLQPCRSGHAEYTQLCCAAVRALHDNGCFCAWDSSASMSTWTQGALAAMHTTYTYCTGLQAACTQHIEDVPAVQGAERPPAEDALHRLREWLHSLPQQMRFKDAAGMASQEHTLVLEWTQDVDSSQLSNIPTNLDVELEIEAHDSASLWNELMHGDMASVGQWFVRLLFGMDEDDPMDSNDDMSLLINAILDVVNEVGTHLQGQNFSLSLEVTIEDENEKQQQQELGVPDAMPLPSSSSSSLMNNNNNKQYYPGAQHFWSAVRQLDASHMPPYYHTRPPPSSDMPLWRRPAVLSATWLLLVVTTVASLGVVVCNALHEASHCMTRQCGGCREWASMGDQLVAVEYVQGPREEEDALKVPLLVAEMPHGR